MYIVGSGISVAQACLSEYLGEILYTEINIIFSSLFFTFIHVHKNNVESLKQLACWVIRFLRHFERRQFA